MKVVKNTLMALGILALTTTHAQAAGRTLVATPARTGIVPNAVHLGFGAADKAYNLFVAYGAVDGGDVMTNWERYEFLSEIPAATTAYDYTTMPAGWGEAFKFMRFFLTDGSETKPFDRQVAYVQGSGNGYFLTDFTPTGDSVVEADLQLTDTAALQTAFCTRKESDDRFVLFMTGSWRSLYGNSDTSSGALDSNRHIVRMGPGLTVDGTPVHARKPQTFVGGTPLVLFAAQTGLANFGFYGTYRLYSFRAWAKSAGGETALDLVPCVKDGAAALYDAHSGRIVPVTGTAFSAGEEVPFRGFRAVSASACVPAFAAQSIVVAERKTGDLVTGADLSFAAVSHARNLVMAYGASVGGETPYAWERCEKIAEIPAAATSYSCESMPADWGSKYKSLRFFLVDGSSLPFDKQVEYVQGSGSGYVNTGYTPTSGTTVELDLQLTDTANAQGIFTARSNNNQPSDFYNLFWLGSNWRWDYASWGTAVTVKDASQRLQMSLGAEVSVVGEGVKIPYVEKSFTAGSPLVFFASQTGLSGFGSYGTYRLYSCRVRENGKSVLNLVPCVKAGVAALYDAANDRFLPITGTAFTASATEVPCMGFAVEASSSLVLSAGKVRTVTATPNAAADEMTAVDLVFGAGGFARSLFVAYGRKAGGDSPFGWEKCRFLATVDPETSSYRFTDIPAGWGTAYRAMRFFLVDPDGLPFDRSVEFVQGSGNGYILTDFTPTGDSVAEADLQRTDTSVQTVFCSRKESDDRFVLFLTDYWRRCYGSADVSGGSPDLYRHVVRMGPGLTVDEKLIQGQTPQTFVGGTPLVLFAAQTGLANFGYYGTYRLYSFKAWAQADDEDAALDLVPCVKDGVASFYDARRGTVLPVAGTPFLAGPATPAQGHGFVVSSSSSTIEVKRGLAIIFR